MKLKRFTGSGVHGFLKFDLPFRDDLTFVTGNNGSGKTSALNAVLGLVTPDLAVLANLEFEHINIDLETNDKSKLKISARPIENAIEITCSSVSEAFVYNRFIPDPDVSSFRSGDHEMEYYRELLSSFATHPVIRTISALPTPMFLGLDRRPRFGDDGRRARPPSRGPRTRNPFGGSLNASVIDAAGLAEDRNREAVIGSSRIVEELQAQMLLNLITVIPGESSDFIGLKVPTRAERQHLRQVRRNLSSIAEVLRLQPRALTARLTPLLDKLDRVAKDIPESATFDSVFGEKSVPPDEHLTNAIFTWSANQPHLDRIKAISEIAEQYNQMRTATLAPIERYRKLINDFLSDSGKNIIFNDRGEIVIKIDGVDSNKTISQLSSGEAQLFVILTHLALSPMIASSVFIIDEPEVSLHVRWQEMFVDSLRAANENIQYILATHSPSIILDRLQNCVDADLAKGRPLRGGKKQSK